jgi:tetratricopeptide (TPR) repeat protein
MTKHSFSGQVKRGVTGLIMVIFLVFVPEVYAQTNYPADPLNSSSRDPLLPETKRPLTPQQQQDLQQAIQDLEAQANTAQAEGNLDQAFALWYRALRLRQPLDLLGEIEALARVGQVAWENNRTEDLQIIRQRLDTIAAQENLTPAQLQALAQAYGGMQIPQSAAQTYRRFLAQADPDLSTQQTLLQKIAELHLAGFHYPEAAQAYTEWLGLQAVVNPTPDTIGVWEQLAYIYDQSQQPEQAIAAKEELLTYYQGQGQDRKVAELQIAIAQDYQTLNQAETASQYYQAAFNTAWELQQFDDAEAALDSLAGLYYRYGELDYALQVYEELLKVQQNSYDYYGLMNTYDRMGTILAQQGETPKALAIYEKALEVARSLNYRQGYFQEQIEFLQLSPSS